MVEKATTNITNNSSTAEHLPRRQHLASAFDHRESPLTAEKCHGYASG